MERTSRSFLSKKKKSKVSCCVEMLEEALNRSNLSSDGGSINKSMITITGELREIMDVSRKWIRGQEP